MYRFLANRRHHNVKMRQRIRKRSRVNVDRKNPQQKRRQWMRIRLSRQMRRKRRVLPGSRSFRTKIPTN